MEEELEDIIEDNTVKEDYAIDIDVRDTAMSAPVSCLGSHNRLGARREKERVPESEASVISHNAVSCANPVE